MPKTDDDETRDDDQTRDDQTTDDTGQDDADDAAQRNGDDNADDDGTDWKAEARKHEKRAKANATKAKKWDEAEATNKSEAERLQTERDEAQKRAQAATDRAVKAEVKSVARDLKFRDPADALRLVELSELADEDGEVDETAVTKALKKIAKDKPYLVANETAGRSGGDFSGGTGAKSDASSMSVDDFRKARKRR
jgi:hypothetical protein